MATYRPLAGSASAIQEPRQHQSAVGDRFNGNRSMRTEWWWQAGPVDSCCCCCSLRTGVGLLAVDALFAGVWIIFFMHAFFSSFLEMMREISEDQYARFCGPAAINTRNCEQIRENIQQIEGISNLTLHLPTSIYVQAVFAFLAGAIGLWAVCSQSQRAAKMYMLSWPVRAVLTVWGALDMYSLKVKYGVDQGHAGIIYFISSIFVLYYFKVSWSYYKKRLDHDKASSDSEYEVTPMVAINTVV